jgi:hypothetical protein
MQHSDCRVPVIRDVATAEVEDENEEDHTHL